MVHEDKPEPETATEAHIVHDKEPIRVDPSKVTDDSTKANY